MLTPDEVTFHRDPVTGAVQAYCTLASSRRNPAESTPGYGPGFSTTDIGGFNVKKQEQPMFVGLPPSNSSGFNGYQTVPSKLKNSSHDSPQKGKNQRVELPYMVPISSSNNPFQATIPNDYSVDDPTSSSFHMQNWQAPGSSSSSRGNFNPFSPNEPLIDARDSYESGCYETIPGENDYEEVNYGTLYGSSKSPGGTLQYNDTLPMEATPNNIQTDPSTYTLSNDTYGRNSAGRVSSFLLNQQHSQGSIQSSRPPDQPDVYGAQTDLYGSQGNSSEQYTL